MTKATKAILYDANLCVGCLECERGCAAQNSLPYDDAIAAEKRTSAHKFTYVAVQSGETYMRRMCMHCDDPACASVCPVGALEKTKLGAVVYDASKCMGCRYCMVACPFNIPKYEWAKAIPTVRKCTMCYAERTSKGKPPACAEACPTGATVFGDRAELLTEARKRLAESPEQYVNHIYGESEVGGTSNLFLSSAPFERFGLETLPPDKLPDLTGKALHFVPDVAVIGGTLLGGIYWITNRRAEVEAAEKSSETKRK